jgi:nucleoside-diphosphate-sugar epimerase
MKNVFITGATSFIGINLIEELYGKYNITAIIRNNSKKKALLSKYKDIEIIELDMQDLNKLSKLTNKKCDVFYHLAWDGTRGASREDEELQKSNYKNSVKVLKVAKELGVETFVTAGSQAEYGLHNELVTEDTKEKPVTQYGIYKLKLCNYAKDYCKKNNIVFIEPRFFSLYGAGDFENTLVISAIDKMLNNEEINLTACTQIWNYLHIKDAVKALVLLQNTKKSGIYNMGSDDTRLLKEFIEEMYTITKSKSKLNIGAVPYPSSGPVNVNPSSEKLKKTIKWHAKVKFSEGIKEIIKERSKK